MGKDFAQKWPKTLKTKQKLLQKKEDHKSSWYSL
jgi:hypothetical protein